MVTDGKDGTKLRHIRPHNGLQGFVLLCRGDMFDDKKLAQEDKKITLR